jgi:hypothetical protein
MPLPKPGGRDVPRFEPNPRPNALNEPDPVLTSSNRPEGGACGHCGRSLPEGSLVWRVVGLPLDFCTRACLRAGAAR